MGIVAQTFCRHFCRQPVSLARNLKKMEKSALLFVSIVVAEALIAPATTFSPSPHHTHVRHECGVGMVGQTFCHHFHFRQ